MKENKLFNPQFASIEATKDLIIPHKVLENVFKKNAAFYNDPRSVPYMMAQYSKFVERFSECEYVKGVAGLGYPFYYLDHHGIPTEFERYGNEIVAKLKADIAQNPLGYLCAKCQIDNSLPDLKTFCDECGISKLRPRHIFKLLPDLDIILLTDNESDQVLADVESVSQALGFQQSDVSITHALRDADASFDAFAQGDFAGSSPFPVDLHIVEVEYFKERLKVLLSLTALNYNTNIDAKCGMKAMWAGWQHTDIDIVFDTLFSLTVTDIKDSELSDLLAEVFGHIKKEFTFDQFIDLLISRSERVSRLLNDSTIRSNLKMRYDKF